MKKIAAPLYEMEGVEISMGCPIEEPECFLKKHLPKGIPGLEEVLDSDISFLNSKYSTIRDIYDEYVDKTLESGLNVEAPDVDISSFDAKLREMEQAREKLEQIHPVILEIINESLELDNLEEDDFYRLLESFGGTEELKSEEFDSEEMKAQAFSERILKKQAAKRIGSSKGIAKDIYEKVFPIRTIMAAKYMDYMVKEFDEMGTDPNEYGKISYGSELLEILLRSDVRLWAKNLSSTPLFQAKAFGAEIAKGAIIDYILEGLGPWVMGAIAFIFSMLGFLMINHISEAFDEFDTAYFITLILEIAASFVIGAGVAAVGVFLLRAKKMWDRFKGIYKAGKSLVRIRKAMDEKIMPPVIRLIQITKSAYPEYHKQIIAKVAKDFPGYSEQDVKNMLENVGSIKKGGNLLTHLNKLASYLKDNNLNEEYLLLKKYLV